MKKEEPMWRVLAPVVILVVLVMTLILVGNAIYG